MAILPSQTCFLDGRICTGRNEGSHPKISVPMSRSPKINHRRIQEEAKKITGKEINSNTKNRHQNKENKKWWTSSKAKKEIRRKPKNNKG